MITQNNKICNKYILKEQYLARYYEYQFYLEKLNLAVETKEWRLKHIRGFLCFLEQHEITFNKLKHENVYDYMISISNLATRTKEHRAVCIRLFLNWMNEKKYTSINGKTIFPIIKCNKNSTLVSNYSQEEIVNVLNSINPTEKNGKRDLAIMLLFTHFGLRLKDVQNLKLSDIKWNENRIILFQSKNNYLSSYMMSEDVRYSLIDYLKNERQENNNSEYVFIDDNGKRYSSNTFYNIVNKYFKKAKVNIKNKKHGPHSLRHSLATISLDNNRSIYEVAEILGHFDVESSKIYSKVDNKTLKKLSLEVPTWKI